MRRRGIIVPAVAVGADGFLPRGSPLIPPMSSYSIQPAHWQHSDDAIHASGGGHGDAGRSDAWAKVSAMFIDGCELGERWTQPGCVRLLDTGFGRGVNFLATWASLRASGGPARLHYVAVEKHPFTQQDLRAALAHSITTAPVASAATLRELAERLVAQWPPLIPGFHALELDPQLTLTLVFGDVNDALPDIAGRFDVFFLDDLALNHDPSMGLPQVLSQLAASDARDARSLPSSAIVIGAGIAGASAARQLARRGIAVTVLERTQPASGGSGNPVGIVRPEPGGALNPITELTAAGVTWLRRWMAQHGGAVPHDWCGVLRIARDARKHHKMLEQAAMVDDSWLKEVDTNTAAQLCAATPADSGFHLPHAGWVSPPALVAAMLDDTLIRVHSNAAAMRVEHVDNEWCVLLADGSVIAAPLVVMTTAFDEGLGPRRFELGRARGQLSCLPARDDHPLAMVVCRDGYISPAVDGVHTVGATVQHDDEDSSPRRSDDMQNFDRLQRLLPGFADDPSQLQSGRVGWRATTQDRVPLVGKVADGLYASLGHGARGITCAPLCAEFLAAMICDEPLPLGRDWISRLDPLRMSRD